MELKAIRTKRNMSREALAGAVGVSVFTVRNWEQGQREPCIAHLVRLADTLGCTVDALLGRERTAAPAGRRPGQDGQDQGKEVRA